MESPTDEVLLQQIAIGDEHALGRLYDRYGRAAYSLAYRILGNVKEAMHVRDPGGVFNPYWVTGFYGAAAKGNKGVVHSSELLILSKILIF